MNAYTAQIWQGETLIDQTTGLNIDAARDICERHPNGDTGRVWLEGGDYTEVYAADGSLRIGPYAYTTRVGWLDRAHAALAKGVAP